MAEDRPADPGVLQRQASDPGASVWVMASAGSGKTKVLTDRLLRLLLAGTPPGRILALTFTKAAAAEMATRLNRILAGWAVTGEAELVHDGLAPLLGRQPSRAEIAEARRLFAKVLDTPGGLKIQTIHAFCQAVLRRFPLEAGLPPQFQVMEETTADTLLAQARDDVLRHGDTSPAIGRAVADLVAHLDLGQFADLMGRLVFERSRFQRLLQRQGGREGAIAATAAALDLAPDTTAEAELAAGCRDSRLDRTGLQQAVAALEAGSKTDRERAADLASWLEADEAGRLAEFDRYAGVFVTDKGELRAAIATKKTAQANPAAAEALAAEGQRVLALLERRRAAVTLRATAALLTLAEALLASYSAAKSQRGLLDYDDLIAGTVDLLGRSSAADWVLYKLDGGLDHILIDEAQDTNPDQWRIVRHLAGEFAAGESARSAASGPRTVFAVGDEKQSIYSFQRADPAAFDRMRRYFGERLEAAGQSFTTVPLNLSFRSTPAVLAAVDAVFADPETRAGVVADPATPIRHQAHRRGAAGRVELWPPVAPADSAEPEAWHPPTTRRSADHPPARLARGLAATVAGWLAEGEPLPAQGRAMEAGDILVLVRRRTGFVDSLVSALTERAVPVAGVDRLVLTDQLAVQDLMALGQFLLLPEDDLNLAALLKAPFLGLDEESLYRLARYDSGKRRSGRLWPALQALAEREPDGALAAAAAWLAGWRSRADFDRPYELFAGVLAAPCPADGRSAKRALLHRLGRDADEALGEFLNRALAYERSHPPALQHFLHWLASGAATIKRDQESTAGGAVRIMTVHGAKGLQAPVVILPDTLQKPSGENFPLLWPSGGDDPTDSAEAGEAGADVLLWPPRKGYAPELARQRLAARESQRDAEYRRLLYVALTRAEDRLILCGWHTKKAAPADCWYRLCQAAWQELGRLAPFDLTPQLGAAAGWAGEARVIEDPQTAPVPEAAAEQEADSAAPPPPWLAEPPEREPEPPRPLSPSRPRSSAPPALSPLAGGGPQRFQRGTAIHRLLQTLPDLPAERRGPAARAFLQRDPAGLDSATVEATVGEVLAVLDDPATAPLFASPALVEVPVTARLGSEILAGQIDRLVVRPDTVWLVDYKTSRPAPTGLAEVAEAYLDQLAAYRGAVARLYPDRPCRCFLVYTDGPRLLEVPAERLAERVPAGGLDRA